jgi:hypothetical protein
MVILEYADQIYDRLKNNNDVDISKLRYHDPNNFVSKVLEWMKSLYGNGMYLDWLKKGVRGRTFSTI